MQSYWFSNQSNINIIYNISVVTITITMSVILANFGKYAISECPFICLSVRLSVTPFYPSALRAGGILSSRFRRAGGRVLYRQLELTKLTHPGVLYRQLELTKLTRPDLHYVVGLFILRDVCQSLDYPCALRVLRTSPLGFLGSLVIQSLWICCLRVMGISVKW